MGCHNRGWVWLCCVQKRKQWVWCLKYALSSGEYLLYFLHGDASYAWNQIKYLSEVDTGSTQVHNLMPLPVFLLNMSLASLPLVLHLQLRQRRQLPKLTCLQRWIYRQCMPQWKWWWPLQLVGIVRTSSNYRIPTGWSVRLITSFCWLHNKSSITVSDP